MSIRFRSVATATLAAGVLAAALASDPNVVTAARHSGPGPRGADQIEAGRLKADLSFIAAYLFLQRNPFGH